MRRQRASYGWVAGWGLGLGGCRGGWIQGLAVGRVPCCCPSWRRGGTPSCWGRPDPQSTADHSRETARAARWATRLQTGSWALGWGWKERKSISQVPSMGWRSGSSVCPETCFPSLGQCLPGSSLRPQHTEQRISLGFSSCHTPAHLGTYPEGLPKIHEGPFYRPLTRIMRYHPCPASLRYTRES